MTFKQRFMKGLERTNAFLDRHPHLDRYGQMALTLGGLVAIVAFAPRQEIRIEKQKPQVAVEYRMTDEEALAAERLSSSLRRLVISLDRLDKAVKKLAAPECPQACFKPEPEDIFR